MLSLSLELSKLDLVDLFMTSLNEPHHGKSVFGVSAQVQHKPGCTVTEAG